MKPDRPETGYGYIRYNQESFKLKEDSFIKVDKFVEKPNLEKAELYVNTAAADKINMKLDKSYIANAAQTFDEITVK